MNKDQTRMRKLVNKILKEIMQFHYKLLQTKHAMVWNSIQYNFILFVSAIDCTIRNFYDSNIIVIRQLHATSTILDPSCFEHLNQRYVGETLCCEAGPNNTDTTSLVDPVGDWRRSVRPRNDSDTRWW